MWEAEGPFYQIDPGAKLTPSFLFLAFWLHDLVALFHSVPKMDNLSVAACTNAILILG